MRQGIRLPRSGCALQGAVAASLAVGGFVPIIHSTAGCGLQHLGSVGLPLPGRLCGAEVPSSNVRHKEVIFGGYARMGEEIKNAVRVMRGDLYLVIPGCATEMVGDDVKQSVTEFKEQGYPIVQVNTTGFKGTAYDGYVQFSKDVLGQLPPAGDVVPAREPHLVNLLGDVPGADPFWEGNLNELTEILGAIGVSATRLFGYRSSLAQWRLASSAQLNVVFSTWGRAVATWMEKTFGTPFLELPSVPVGPEQTSDLLRAVADRLSLDQDDVGPYVATREEEFLYRLAHASSDYVRYGFQGDFAMVGESYVVLGLARFLRDTLGCGPQVLVMTDWTPTSAPVDAHELCADLGAEVLYGDDQDEIEELLRAHPVDVVLGSALEGDYARAAGLPLCEISAPLGDTVLLGSGCAGYAGTLQLLETLFTTLKLAKRRHDAAPPLMRTV